MSQLRSLVHGVHNELLTFTNFTIRTACIYGHPAVDKIKELHVNEQSAYLPSNALSRCV